MITHRHTLLFSSFPIAITNTSDHVHKFVTERIETIFEPFLFRSRYSQSDDWRMNDLRAASCRVIKVIPAPFTKFPAS